MNETKIDLLPVSRRTHGVQIDPPKYLVIHWTGGAGHTARGIRNWFKKIGKGAVRVGKKLVKMYASSHYILGLDGVVTKIIPEHVEAFTCGGPRYTKFAKKEFRLKNGKIKPNRFCTSIECTHEDWTGKPNKKHQTHPTCLLYTSPSPRDRQKSRMPSSA